MRAQLSIAILTLAFLCVGFGGCSIGLSGRTTLNNDGSDALVVKAKQPELPPPLPPPRKAKVVGQKIKITEKVMFDFDKATIKEESHDLLNDVAAVMKEYPSILKIRIEGHTDGEGTNSYNQKLSEKRAKSVREFLISAGIDEARMEAVGYGESKPLADNETAEGREKNRRVEFNIIEGSAAKMVELAEGQKAPADAAKAPADAAEAPSETAPAGEK